MKRINFSESELKIIISESFSLAEVLRKTNLSDCGGNYSTINKYIKLYEIDTSHFTGQMWNKNKIFGYKYPISSYLIKGSKRITSHHLRNRLIVEGIKEKKCESCGLNSWLGNDIPLELHHIDGDRHNNTLDNLQILCANCHALTENYCSKNDRRY